MAQSRSAGRPVAIILPLILPIFLLVFCGIASAQTVSLGWGGDGIIPKMGTTNSSYWIRVVYNDGTTGANSTPPISTFQMQNRSGNIMGINMRPFLNQSGLSYIRGILPSPNASTLTGPSGSITYLTTGSRAFSDVLVGSTVDQLTNYTGSDMQITEPGPNSGEIRRVAGFSNFGGMRARTTTSDALGYGPLWATTTAPDKRTVICNQLPAGDWTGSQVRIIGPAGHPLIGETRLIGTYTLPDTIVIDAGEPDFFLEVAQATEFLLIGPYTTTSDGTVRVLVCTGLPGVLGQWDGGMVRITGPTGNPLVGEEREIASYNPLTNIIVTTSAFPQTVTTGIEFQLDGLTLVDRGLGGPGSGETWHGAQITITQDPHPALGEARNVVAWSPDTGTFRVDRPLPGRIVSGDAYEIFLAILTLDAPLPVVMGPDERFRVLGPGLGVPEWYLSRGGAGLSWSGITAAGKIIVGAEDDLNRDGDLLDPGDTPPGGGDPSDLYLFMSTRGSPPDIRYSIGPWTVDHGLLSGSAGSLKRHEFRFRVRYGEPPPATVDTPDAPVDVCGSAGLNRDWLSWKGAAPWDNEPDPLSIYDQPPWLVNTPSSGNSGFNTADDGTSSSIYTFQCMYRHGDGLPPRFNWDSRSIHSDIPAFQGTLERWTGHDAVPMNSTVNYDWFYHDDDDNWLHQESHLASGVALIIDGDFMNPHFMIPIDANGNVLNINNLTPSDYQAGVRFVYQILPTGYHPFLLSYADVSGRPIHNTFVNFRPLDSLSIWLGDGHYAKGLHSYQFLCTDDFLPPWRQPDIFTGRPSVRSFNIEYTSPVLGAPVEDTETTLTPVSDFRHIHMSGIPPGGPYSYPIDSVDELNSTPGPFDPYGQPTFAVRDNDPVLYAPRDNPFAPLNPPQAGDYPTNDGTISPNFFVDFPDLTARADNRWLQSDMYSFFINYASSQNKQPLQIEMLLRREGSIDPADVTTDPTTVSYVIPMQQVDPGDSDYMDGAAYFCTLSPLSLPDPPGAASNTQVDDYQYFFRASDGTRTVWFPRRPERVDPIIGRTFDDDPFDFGVRVRDANNDYYFFRVNTPPVLANGDVTPTSQRPGLPFTYTADYSDIDGAFRVNFGNSSGQDGDGVFRANLSIDTFGDRDGELRVVSVVGALISYERVDGFPVTYIGDGQVNDADGDGFDDAANVPAGNVTVDELYHRPPSIPTVNWRGREVKFETGLAADTDPILIDTNDGTGSPPTITLASAPSGVAPGDIFTIVDWATTSMSPVVPSDVDFTTPNGYDFNTGTIVDLTPGRLHEYFFEFADDHGDWLYPDDVDQRREGEVVRLPDRGGFGSPDNFGGPEVLVNQAPVLSNFTFSPDPTPTGPGNDARVGSGTPGDNADGNTATPFTVRFTYRDLDNDPPSEIFLGLDGTPVAPNRIIALTEQDPGDTLYSDGKVYEAQIRMGVDLNGHILRGRATDGLGGVFPSATVAHTGVTTGGGSTTFVIDSTLGGNDDDWIGALLRITSGPAAGEQLPVVDYTASSGWLQVPLPGFSIAIPAGTTYALIIAGYSDPPAPNGPIVIPNTAPQLFFPAEDEPDGSAPSMNPPFPPASSGLTWPAGGFLPDDHEFVAGQGTISAASGDGAADGSTLVDSTLGGVDDEWIGAQLLITSGLARGERQTAIDYEAATGTLTVFPMFSMQILGGTTYELSLQQRSPGLEADSGPSTDTYTYRAIYFDPDTFSPEQRGDPPEFVRLIIDSGQNQPGGFAMMTQVDPADTDYTDGAEFTIDVSGGTPILAAGSPHNFYFEARDGLDTAKLPNSPPVPGPIIDDPPAAPWNLSALNVPGDQGGQIELQWRKSPDDGGGGDVIRYSLRRQVAGTGQPISDPVAGAPFEIASILADGRDPYILLDSEFDAVPRVQSQTTAAGTSTTVIDSTLGGVDDEWNGGTVTILSGAAIGEERPVVDYDVATGSLTVSPAFSAAIGAGTDYVVALLDRLGQNPADGRDVVATDYEYVVLAFDDVSDGSTSLSSASNIAQARPADDMAPTAPPGQGGGAQPDGSILVTWTASPEDPALALPIDPPPPVGDIIGYRVYRDESFPVDPEGTSATLVELANETGTGLIPPALGGQLGPGDTSLLDSTAALDTDYYYLVRAVDRTQASTNDGGTGPHRATDTQPPSFDSFDPPDADTGVSINTDITFQVHDPGNGVDVDTLIMMLDVGGTPEGPFDKDDFQITQLVVGEDTDLEVVFDRASPLPTNTLVTVSLWAIDKGGNGSAPPAPAMNTPWSFTTETAQTIEGTIQLTTDGTTPLLLALDVTINVTGPSGALPAIVVTTNAATGAASYVIGPVTGGDYDITPVLSGTTWDLSLPQTVTVPSLPSSGSVAGPDFVGTLTTYTLSGVAQDNVGNPVPGVTITVDTTDGTAPSPVLTQTDGSYSIAPALQGTYTLTPSLAGFTFSPTDQTVTAGVDPTDNLDFFILFSISGTVTRSDTGEGLEGVAVSANGQQATTDANGDYTITDLAAGDIEVVPAPAEFTFTPVSQTVTVNVTTGNRTGIDFEASAVLYSISGTVTLGAAGGLAGLTITVSATDGPSTPSAATVDSATGAYTITGLEAGTYTVTPSEATGAAQFSPASQQVTVPPSQISVNFTGFRVFQVIAPASGLQLLTAPFTAMTRTPAITAADVFDTDSVATWDPLGMPAGYVLFSVDRDNPALRVEPGRGFFARIPVGPLPLVPGTPAPTDRAFPIPIFSEWTMAGNPFLAAFAWSSVQQSSPAVSDLAWVYVNDGTNGGYVLVTDMQAFNTLTTIEPYQGFWQRVTVGTVGASITISPPAGALSRSAEPDAGPPEDSAKPRSLVDGGWLIQVVAATVKTRDACNYVGVGAPARGVVSTLKIDNPPAAAGYADIYFDGAAQGEPGRRLAAHIRAADAAELAFDFVVATDLVNEDVTVSLPNLAQLSKQRQVLLTDLDAGETVFARTKSAYTYNSGDGGERHFRIEVREAVQTGLRVVGLHGAPTRGARGAGAEIRYSLTAPAAVTTQIYNVSGRLVARVESATSRGAGSAAALWNGRSLAGTQVPSGVYSVRVTATGEQGIKADAITTILIRR